jgi:hypothetical protein
MNAQGSNVKRRIGTPGGAVHTAAWLGRLSAEALELGTLVTTAAVAHVGRRALRRVNRRGLLGWGTVLAVAALLTGAIVELVELL